MDQEEKIRRLTKLYAEIDQCHKCVFGERAPVPRARPRGSVFLYRAVIIGMAPGKVEEEDGKYFVGPAGKELDQQLAKVGIPTKHIYITNIVKCRTKAPEGSGKENITPPLATVDMCSGYLKEELEALAPKIIVCAGKLPAAHLLSTVRPNDTMASIFGKHTDGFSSLVPDSVEEVIVIYHPAAFLYPKDLDIHKKMLDKQMAQLRYIKEAIENHG